MKNITTKIALTVTTLAALTAGLYVAYAKEPTHSKITKGQTVQAPASGTTKAFGDWGVTCNDDTNGQKICTLAQELRRKNDNARITLLEVKPNGMSQASAGLTLPFGLDMRQGLSLQVDDGQTVQGIAFSTCYQQGCLVPMNFDAGTLNALRSGKVLKITGKILNGNAINFQIPLQGFGDAYTFMNNLSTLKK